MATACRLLRTVTSASLICGARWTGAAKAASAACLAALMGAENSSLPTLFKLVSAVVATAEDLFALGV